MRRRARRIAERLPLGSHEKGRAEKNVAVFDDLINDLMNDGADYFRARKFSG
jgi:hypothetical protein